MLVAVLYGMGLYGYIFLQNREYQLIQLLTPFIFGLILITPYEFIRTIRLLRAYFLVLLILTVGISIPTALGTGAIFMIILLFINVWGCFRTYKKRVNLESQKTKT